MKNCGAPYPEFPFTALPHPGRKFRRAEGESLPPFLFLKEEHTASFPSPPGNRPFRSHQAISLP
ncbi:MAG TPA: hypothetical protein DDX86_05460 [Akkermansia sp.]|nr:hypothetical protein [Akkermansia sp.]